MNDKELLEFAAKSIGLLPLSTGQELDYSENGLMFCGNGKLVEWEPLTNDGDALRLAVKLKFGVNILDTDVRVATPYGAQCIVEVFYNGADEYSATRLAIVRAAAEIGRNMK